MHPKTTPSIEVGWRRPGSRPLSVRPGCWGDVRRTRNKTGCQLEDPFSLEVAGRETFFCLGRGKPRMFEVCAANSSSMGSDRACFLRKKATGGIQSFKDPHIFCILGDVFECVRHLKGTTLDWTCGFVEKAWIPEDGTSLSLRIHPGNPKRHEGSVRFVRGPKWPAISLSRKVPFRSAQDGQCLFDQTRTFNARRSGDRPRREDAGAKTETPVGPVGFSWECFLGHFGALDGLKKSPFEELSGSLFKQQLQ